MQYWAISHYQKPRLPIKETIKIVWLISSANTDMHDVQYVEQKQTKKIAITTTEYVEQKQTKKIAITTTSFRT